MNNKDWLEYHKAMCQKMHDITVVKNKDYTGDSSNPFYNFENVERLGVCPTEQGFLVRMTDKMARITSFTKTGQLLVKDESVEDTLLDLANYCILFMGYLESKKPKKTEENNTTTVMIA